MRYRRDGFSVESAIAKQRKLPQWFLDEPFLLIGDEFYIKEFWMLHTTRAIGANAFGPIPVDKIEERGERRHGFQDDLLDLYVDVIRQMDEGFLDWMSEEHKRAVRQGRNSGGNSATERPARTRKKNPR
ncbi:MAG: hypothetical protein DRJ50_02765 [Actinobacteria bacterium]|nr:MAG: hypothetical protein DRJ50_02765 [Actinomycetota bacterium]